MSRSSLLNRQKFGSVALKAISVSFVRCIQSEFQLYSVPTLMS